MSIFDGTGRTRQIVELWWVISPAILIHFWRTNTRSASTRRVLFIFVDLVPHKPTPKSKFLSARLSLNRLCLIPKLRVFLLGLKILSYYEHCGWVFKLRPPSFHIQTVIFNSWPCRLIRPKASIRSHTLAFV